MCDVITSQLLLSNQEDKAFHGATGDIMFSPHKRDFGDRITSLDVVNLTLHSHEDEADGASFDKVGMRNRFLKDGTDTMMSKANVGQSEADCA